MRKEWMILGFFVLAVLLPSCRPPAAEAPVYPETRKTDQIDDYFGTLVPDPYRWLEDDRSAETEAWVEAQNAVTFGYLENIPFREKIRSRLLDIWNYPRYGSPFRAGDNYFFFRNDGLQNQSVIYIQKGLDGEPEVFIDPNDLSPDGTIRIGLLGFSSDKRYVSISRGEAGSDWSEIRVMEIATKTELPDRIRWVKFSGTAWHGDGFFYSGYDAPEPGQELTARNEYQKIFYHRLGDPQEKDVLVYEDRDHPLRYVGAGITEDERFLILNVSEGTSGNELYYRDLAAGDRSFKPLIQGFTHDSWVIDSLDGKLLVQTNIGAPNYRVVLIDPRAPAITNWTTVIPEEPQVLRWARTAAGHLFCGRLKDASSRVTQHELDGALVREIELPALGTAGGFSGWKDDTVLFYTFTSHTYPPVIFKYDPVSGDSDIFREAEVQFRPEDYVTKQVFVTSKDGTAVPMFIVHKKDLVLDGRAPAYLSGYGGFNVSILPSFNTSILVLLENGGVFAQPNLRGGGEYGEAWHKAGMLENKQNVFDDFIAAAEYLVREKYTSPERLAIAGGSNGGLLVGAAMTQRPDLFGVCFPAVGVLDMLRYHKFTVGWGWVVEYGSSDDPEAFHYLHAYSPLHNIREGICYPATLVTTADHDDRVVPAHSFKFIAELQDKQACPNPVLIRIETRSGHGASNVTKAIDEATDKWAFMFHVMGLNPKY